MRDDIHKAAPLPAAWKQAIKACGRDADWKTESLNQLAFDLAEATHLPRNQVRERIQQLVPQHHTEWTNMISGLRPGSWVRQKLEVLHAAD